MPTALDSPCPRGHPAPAFQSLGRLVLTPRGGWRKSRYGGKANQAAGRISWVHLLGAPKDRCCSLAPPHLSSSLPPPHLGKVPKNLSRDPSHRRAEAKFDFNKNEPVPHTIYTYFHGPEKSNHSGRMKGEKRKLQKDASTGSLFPGDTEQAEAGTMPSLPEVASVTFLPNSLAQRCSIMASDFNSLSHGGHTVVPRKGKEEKEEL